MRLASVVIPRYAEALIDAPIFGRALQHHALGELLGHAAVDLLPGCLRGRIAVTSRRIERPAPRGELGIAQEHLDSALAQVDPQPIAGPQ